MKTNTSVPDSERTGENRIIRRDTECLLARGGLARMSEAEADRHMLVMMLGVTRAQLLAAREDLAMVKADSARWMRLAVDQRLS